MNLNELFESLRTENPCWKGYHPVGTKKKDGRTVPNCVPNANEGVAEGSLNEFAPDGFNGGDDGDEFSPEIAKMAQEDGFTKGVSLADGATLEQAMAINHWHSQHGGMYKQYFAKGFKAGRMNKINHDNKQYNLNLKLMKDGSIRHGQQGVAEEEKNPFKNPLGKALYRDLSKEKKASPAQVQRNKERWAQRQAEREKQGVAEGLNDTIYPNAEVIKSKNGKPVGEIYQDGKEWGCFHYRADRGYDMIDSREDAIQALKDLHAETARHRPDYTIKGVAEGEREFKGANGPVSVTTTPGRTVVKRKEWDDPKTGSLGNDGKFHDPNFAYFKSARKSDYDSGDYSNDRDLGEGNKVGHMDADDFDDAMARLKQLAGQGPRKTVWDPVKRVYKTVPVAQQPKQQPSK